MSLSKTYNQPFSELRDLPVHVVIGMYHTAAKMSKEEAEAQDKESNKQKSSFSMPSLPSMPSIPSMPNIPHI